MTAVATITAHAVHRIDRSLQSVIRLRCFHRCDLSLRRHSGTASRARRARKQRRGIQNAPSAQLGRLNLRAADRLLYFFFFFETPSQFDGGRIFVFLHYRRAQRQIHWKTHREAVRWDARVLRYTLIPVSCVGTAHGRAVRSVNPTAAEHCNRKLHNREKNDERLAPKSGGDTALEAVGGQEARTQRLPNRQLPSPLLPPSARAGVSDAFRMQQLDRWRSRSAFMATAAVRHDGFA